MLEICAWIALLYFVFAEQNFAIGASVAANGLLALGMALVLVSLLAKRKNIGGALNRNARKIYFAGYCLITVWIFLAVCDGVLPYDFWLVAAGSALNTLATAANGMKMPAIVLANEAQLQKSWRHTDYRGAEAGSVRFKFLADRFSHPLISILGLASAGDIMIWSGLIAAATTLALSR